MNKESLRKLTISELEGQLVAVKENYQATQMRLSIERQNQIIKAKVIRGKASKRREELIRQILKIQRETSKVEAKINAIQIRNEMNMHLPANYIGKRQNLTIDDDGYRYREIIAKYEDYIKAGRIKRQSSLSKYEAADWFADNYMSEEDMKKAIEAADERREKAAIKEARIRKERVAWAAQSINF